MRTIRAKVLASGLAITLLLALILGSTMSFIFYRSSVNTMEETVASNAKAYASSITNQVNVFREQLKAAARQTDFTNEELPLEQRQSLLAEFSTLTLFKDFSISDAQGLTYSDTDISKRDYFQQAMAGNTYISSPIIRLTDGSTTIMGASKLDNGSFDGAVYGGIDYTIFSSIISNIRISKTGYGFIVDKNGAIIAHPDQQIVVDFATDLEQAKTSNAGKAISSFVDGMMSLEDGDTTYTYDDSKKYVSYVPVEGVEGWSLAITVDYSDILSDFYNSIIVMIIIVVAMIILGTFISFSVARKISRPIEYVTSRLEDLSNGDLTSEVKIFNNKDETGKLSQSLESTISTLKSYIFEINQILGSIGDNNLDVSTKANYLGDFVPINTALSKIISSLNKTIGIVHTSALNFSGDSRQVAANSTTLSQLTTEQAATVQEISSTITEISDQIKNNANSAQNASLLTKNVEDNIAVGNEKMNNLLDAMEKIKSSSAEINNIIKTIDDIAFQTNILALNASVEAARAGSAGKGFAIVAEEVRNLALKSATAAKDTAKHIVTSMKSVEAGTLHADEAANAINTIVSETHKTTELINEIATESNKQALAVDSINIGMSQISMVTQNNSASAEEGAAASEELLKRSDDLLDIVKSFTLKSDETTPNDSNSYNEPDDDYSFIDLSLD